MVALVVSRLLLKRTLLFSLAFGMIHIVAMGYFSNGDWDNIDLGYLSGRTVVIDPGHGGIDSGARYNNLVEKDLNLAISLKLGELLQTQGMTVIYTRAGDVDYYTQGSGGKRNDLLKRIEMINQAGADLFISIHCNAIRGERWKGAQVFYNNKIVSNGSLADIMQTLLKDFPPHNKRQPKADTQILLLKNAEIPGVLVETGYLSNKYEAALLNDTAYQAKLVGQIAKAVAGYFKTSEQNSCLDKLLYVFSDIVGR